MIKKIARPIVSFNVVNTGDVNVAENVVESVKTDSNPASEQMVTAAKNSRKDDNITYIHEKLERPEKLIGSTYKVKPPGYDNALYITMNDIILNEDTDNPVRKPFEVFINTKNMDHYEWASALTLLISAIFRKGGDVAFIAKELKSVFSPTKGYHKKGYGFMPSLVAEIGNVIEKHMISIGLIEHQGVTKEKIEAAKEMMQESKRLQKAQSEPQNKLEQIQLTADDDEEIFDELPEDGAFCLACGTNAVFRLDNCMTCVNCGESKCG